MKLHELKIKRKYFEEMLSKHKNFELRKNDRDFQVGDLVHFTIVDDKPAQGVLNQLLEKIKYPQMVFRITYVLKDVPEYGLDKDYCIFGLKQMKEE